MTVLRGPQVLDHPLSVKVKIPQPRETKAEEVAVAVVVAVVIWNLPPDRLHQPSMVEGYRLSLLVPMDLP